MSVANWTKYKQIQLFVDRNVVNVTFYVNRKRRWTNSGIIAGAEFLDYLVCIMLVLSMHVAKINSKHIRMYVIICTKYWKSAIGFVRMTDRARYYMKCVKQRWGNGNV